MTKQEVEYGVSAAAETAVAEVEAGTEAAAVSSTETMAETVMAETVMVSAVELAALKAERDNLLDRLARQQAEFDNARKRQEREKAEYRDYATGSVVEQFLPVLDNFALALGAEGTAEQLRTGVELIVKQMDEVLRGLQVTAVPTVGELFDPRVHEALGTVEREDMPDQSVAEEIRKGYRIRERLLRPAMVRIVSNPRQTEA